MKVLALDTASDRLGVGVVADSRVLAEATYTMGRRHGELVAVVIEETLSRVGLRIGDVDGIAVSLGPGSFTGVRIGLAAAKTLSFAGGVPLVGIGSLELLAASAAVRFGLADGAWPDGGAGSGTEAGIGGTVCAVLDARRGDAYAAAYRVPGGAGRWCDEALAPSVGPLADWLAAAAALPGPHWVTGDGVGSLWPDVQAALPGARAAGPLYVYPRPAVLAWLGQQRLAAGDRDDPATLVPQYLRRPPVEEKG